MKKLLLSVCFFLCFFISAAKVECFEPLHYSLSTNLSSSSPDFFNLSMKQQVDFDCEIDSICPIDQTPETVTLTLTRMRGEIDYNDEKHLFDTDMQELYSLEFQCLKKLLNEPIQIHLNKDMTIKEESKGFSHLLNLSTLENYFINQDFLDQIIEAIFIPIQTKHADKPSHLSLYYPFKTNLSPSTEIKEGKEDITLKMSDDLALEGLYSTHQKPFSIHLGGKLIGKAKWTSNTFYCNEFSFSHHLKETQDETLFENPLSFEYSLSLKLTN